MTGDKSITIDYSKRPMAPDSVRTLLGKEALPTKGKDANPKYTITITLDKALAPTDTLMTTLFSLGVPTSVILSTEESNGTLKHGATIPIEAGWTLLARLDGTKWSKSRQGAIEAYADAVLASDPLFSGFPTTHLQGMDSAKIMAEILRRIVSTGVPLEETAGKWGLDLTIDQARSLLLAMTPRLSTSDSAKLFPPPPIGSIADLDIQGTLRRDGSPLPIVGSFRSDKPLASAKLAIFQDSTDVSSKFVFVPTYILNSTEWSFEASASIRTQDALPGKYTLKLVLEDIQGRSFSVKADFTLEEAADKTSPTIVLVKPATAKGTEIPFDSSRVRVVWKMVDPTGIDESSVRIDGGEAVRSGESEWSADIRVPATGLETAILIEGKNTRGFGALEQIWITRAKDTTHPTLSRLSEDRTLPFDSSIASVSWRAWDNDGIRSASLDGSPVAVRVDGIYSSVRDLSIGRNKFTILVEDSTGNTKTDSVIIDRSRDAKGPSVSISSPFPGTVLEYSTSTVAVVASASDPSGIDSFLIQGKTATNSSGTYRGEVSVPPTGAPFGIKIRAVDKLGNPSETTLVVTRRMPPDSLPPQMTLLSPSTTSGTIVPFDSTGILIRWKIVDVRGLADTALRISGIRAVRENDSTWSARVPLRPNGEPTPIASVATNSKGFASTVVVSVARRRDMVSPTCKAGLPAQTKTPFDSSRTNLQWTISDNHMLASASVNGKAWPNIAGKTSTTLETRDTLVVGRNLFRLLVADSSGNTALDSIVVVRDPDTTRPRIAGSSFPSGPVPFAKTATVSFQVDDNDQVNSVTINGRTPTKSGSIHSLVLDLDSGRIPLQVTAKDRNGNTATENFTLEVELKDRDDNVVPFKKMPDSKIWTTKNLQTKPSNTSVKAGLNVNFCINENCSTYGRDYSWAMAMDLPAVCDTQVCEIAQPLRHQGLCMSGFHVPTKEEWQSLLTASAKGGPDSLGISRLKSSAATDAWTATGGDHSGTDAYGFTLLPTSSQNQGRGGSDMSQYWLPADATGTSAAIFQVVQQSRFTVDTKRATTISSFRSQQGLLRCIAD